MLIDKSDKDAIRKRLEEINKLNPSTRQKRKILEELTEIFNDLQFKKKHTNSAFDSSSYYGLKDLEYTFGDLDDYFKPILAKDSFESNYQMYSCRGDKDRIMSISQYLNTVKPYLFALIGEKKNISSQKIQLVKAVNLIHLTKRDRITFYVKSKNITTCPSDKTEQILYQLYDSLLKYFEDKLMICRTDSGYVYESIEGLDIHFHKIDLRRGSSYIPSPEWLLVKKAVVNPKNKKDNYCFAYAPTIAIYHKEIGKHLDRISNELLDCTEKLNWNGTDFPASTSDYKKFKKLNKDIALNVFFIPFNEEDTETMNVEQEYISNYNVTRKIQVASLKISDGKKWHFLALKSEQDNNGFLRPTKSFSRLMAGISSSNHESHYCFGCFHSFRCNLTLEKHTELCKDNDFCKIKLPEIGENIKKHEFGSKSLRTNYIIYVDLECLLGKYDTCTNNPNKSYTINEAQHVPSGYSISIHNNSTNSSKVLYYREKDRIQKLCKELREIGEELFDTKEKTNDTFKTRTKKVP